MHTPMNLVQRWTKFVKQNSFFFSSSFHFGSDDLCACVFCIGSRARSAVHTVSNFLHIYSHLISDNFKKLFSKWANATTSMEWWRPHEYCRSIPVFNIQKLHRTGIFLLPFQNIKYKSFTSRRCDCVSFCLSLLWPSKWFRLYFSRRVDEFLVHFDRKLRQMTDKRKWPKKWKREKEHGCALTLQLTRLLLSSFLEKCIHIYKYQSI